MNRAFLKLVCFASGLLAACTLPVETAWSAVTAAGDVTPAPPAGGGNVAAPFRVGSSTVGTLSITGGTPLAVTGGNAIVGDGATGVGIVQMTGLGSNLSTVSPNDVTIGNNGTGSVTLAQLAQLIVGDDLFLGTVFTSAGDLFVDGLGTLVDVGDSMIVGGFGNGQVQITAGGRIDLDDSIFGQSVGSDGRVTVTGNGSTLAQTNSMTIGEGGYGELRVLDLGKAVTTNVAVGNAATGSGLAVVSGAGTTWTVAGFVNLVVGGLATLNVLDAGRMSMTGALRMATLAGSESDVVVSDANSLLAIGTTVIVGEQGFATLEVRNGGRLTSSNGIIGDNTNSRGQVLVEGNGSLWKITGSLAISDPGEGQLSIADGGQVTASSSVSIAAAGRLAMSGGRLETGGAGLTNNGLIQGYGRITGNANNSSIGKIRLDAGGSLIFASTLGNSGLIDLDASELETLASLSNNSDIDARNGATLRTGTTGLDNNNGSQLSITGGTVDVFGLVDNNTGATIAVVGGATGVFHDNVTNNGTIFVSENSEIVMLENLTFSPSAGLAVEFGASGGSAPVVVSGSAMMSGSLSVELNSAFSPTLGDTLEVLHASGGRFGVFAMESLPVLGGGLTLDVVYTPNSVRIAVIELIVPGDFDSDGDVDGADFVAWQTNFPKASGATLAEGDADGDGDVDGADFVVWQTNFPFTPGPGSSPVPEPAGWILLLAAAIFGGRVAAVRLA
jgi:T5SS/PEP-CTERM-associated repeat protein